MARFVNYIVEYQDRIGVHKATISSFHRLEYAKKENEIGYLYITMPNIYPLNFFEIDGRIIVHRKVGGLESYIEMDAVWLIRVIRTKFESGQNVIHLVCHDGIDIVDRRIVPYAVDNAYTKKTGNADHVINEIMRENFGSLATDSARDISSYFEIQSDNANSGCPEITISFPKRKVLPTLQDICLAAFDVDETYLCFDVLYGGNGKPIFRTFENQRGDYKGKLSDDKFVFSLSAGNIEYATLSYDHLEEYNMIYAGGKGTAEDKIIKTAHNPAWSGISPINRREDWIDVSSETEPNAIWLEARKRLREAGPKVKVNGHIIQTPNSLYGVHYKYGDVCVFVHGGQELDIHLDTVHVQVSGNDDEEVKIYTRNLEDSEY